MWGASATASCRVFQIPCSLVIACAYSAAIVPPLCVYACMRAYIPVRESLCVGMSYVRGSLNMSGGRPGYLTRQRASPHLFRANSGSFRNLVGQSSFAVYLPIHMLLKCFLYQAPGTHSHRFVRGSNTEVTFCTCHEARRQVDEVLRCGCTG